MTVERNYVIAIATLNSKWTDCTQQIIVVAKNITVLQLFISRMPKMCAIPQLVSAP